MRLRWTGILWNGILLTIVAAALLATPADGYRFFARHGGLRRIASVAGAIRWDASAFPLRFRLLENGNLPDFEGLDAALWRESAERGLRAWAEIGTADLELVLDEETVADDQGRAGDAINTIGFSSAERVAGGPFATADVQYTEGRVTGCDVHFSPGYLDGWPDDDAAARAAAADHLARTVMHEVGHCLGLAHSAMNPTWLGRPQVVDQPPGYFPEGRHEPSSPTPGCPTAPSARSRSSPMTRSGRRSSTRRRAFSIPGGRSPAGWCSRTAEPAPFVYVTSVMYTADGALFGPGAFTDSWGQFLLEGLEPGFRHFWIRPLHQLLAHSFVGEAAMRRHPRTPTRAALVRDSCLRNLPVGSRTPRSTPIRDRRTREPSPRSGLCDGLLPRGRGGRSPRAMGRCGRGHSRAGPSGDIGSDGPMPPPQPDP